MMPDKCASIFLIEILSRFPKIIIFNFKNSPTFLYRAMKIHTIFSYTGN